MIHLVLSFINLGGVFEQIQIWLHSDSVEHSPSEANDSSASQDIHAPYGAPVITAIHTEAYHQHAPVLILITYPTYITCTLVKTVCYIESNIL
jgi:hypothetical protein